MLLGSCSQDELVDVNPDSLGDQIEFSVVTNGATRADAVYHNNNMPGSFVVSAKSDQNNGVSYIDGDVIENEGGKWVNKTGTRYWPEGTLDFYAHVNGGNYYKWNVTDGVASAMFKDFKVEPTVANQVDLLYAVTTGQKRETEKTETETTPETDPVTLNFRHALSQIVFQARNDSKNLHVVIEGVDVVNVGGTNTFTFPSASTTTNFDDGTDNPDNSGSGTRDNLGTWGELTAGTASYSVKFSPVTVDGKVDENGDKTKGDVVSLTYSKYDKDNNATPKVSNAMLLLPQTTTAWKAEGEDAESLNATKGSYLLVNCLIYNVSGDKYDASKDICLWGEKGESGVYTAKKLAIPAGFNWEQGKKYLYTLVFGNGNGGYDPGDPDDPTPDPVLVPISFEVTVDDFALVDGGEIEADVPEAGN